MHNFMPFTPQTFKPGDKVVVTGKSLGGYDANGAVGTVRIMEPHGNTPVVVDFPNGTAGRNYRLEQVRLTSATGSFKPGDKVVVTGMSSMDFDARGAVGVVRRVGTPMGADRVVVDFPNVPWGDGRCYDPHQLTLAAQQAPAPTPAVAWEAAAAALEAAGLRDADPYVDIIQRTQPGGLTVRPSATERGKVTVHMTGVRQDVGRRLTPAQARRLAFLLNREADAAERAA